MGGGQVLSQHFDNENSASRSLLNQVCDTVIELDSSGNMVENSPSLKATLFISGNKSLKGMPFEKYVMPSSWEHFQQALQETVDRDLGSNTFHTSLRDSIGNPVKVEIFDVPYRSYEEVHHLIGILEREETQRASADILPNIGTNTNLQSNSSGSEGSAANKITRNRGKADLFFDVYLRANLPLVRGSDSKMLCGHQFFGNVLRDSFAVMHSIGDKVKEMMGNRYVQNMFTITDVEFTIEGFDKHPLTVILPPLGTDDNWDDEYAFQIVVGNCKVPVNAFEISETSPTISGTSEDIV